MHWPTIKRLPLRFYTLLLFLLGFALLTYRAVYAGQWPLALSTLFAAGAAVVHAAAQYRSTRTQVRTRPFVARR